MTRLFDVINWLMGIITLIIVILIILQAYKLLINPTSEDTRKGLSKTILYVFVGIVILGASYMIANFLIIR